MEANFTCVVSCEHKVYWRIGDANFRGIQYLPPKLLALLQSSGIVAHVVNYESCEDGIRSMTIGIVASEDLDGTAVQCKARTTRGSSSNHPDAYSKFAVLHIEGEGKLHFIWLSTLN